MIKVVGVRFQRAGKIYYFDPLDYELEVPMHVIVETARGVEMGTVLIPPKEVEDDNVIQPLKPVIRIASDEDERVVERNREKEKDAFVICKEKIAKHGLEMKLVNAEYTFDNNKLLFYFTADGRIDFRELVKDLASVFRTRIELRQIGVRDETKILGGVGICGRELCCKSYLADFIPVSIKMAKEQNLSLNPTKISGVCGRLMCCLKNEQDTYEYLNSRLPNVGDTVTTPGGMRGNVSSVNVLRQLVKVVVDNGEEKELQEYRVDDLRFTQRRRRDVKLTEEELEELKELESLEDGGESLEERPERAGRENRGNRENRENRGNRDRRDIHGEDGERREYRGNRDSRRNGEDGERRGSRGNQEYRGNRDSRGNGEDGERWENRGNRDSGEGGEDGERRGNRESWDSGENREDGERSENRIGREDGERREYRGNRGDGERRENGGRPANRGYRAYDRSRGGRYNRGSQDNLHGQSEDSFPGNGGNREERESRGRGYNRNRRNYADVQNRAGEGGESRGAQDSVSRDTQDVQNRAGEGREGSGAQDGGRNESNDSQP